MEMKLEQLNIDIRVSHTRQRIAKSSEIMKMESYREEMESRSIDSTNHNNQQHKKAPSPSWSKPNFFPTDHEARPNSWGSSIGASHESRKFSQKFDWIFNSLPSICLCYPFKSCCLPLSSQSRETSFEKPLLNDLTRFILKTLRLTAISVLMSLTLSRGWFPLQDPIAFWEFICSCQH